MHKSLRVLMTIAVSILAVSAFAGKAATRASLLVSPSWLAGHLQDADLVLLHVGNRDEYAAKHIPGARHVALSDISISHQGEADLMLEMPPAGDLRIRLEKLGISDNSRVVVYFGKEWGPSPATRVIFTLDYAGLGDRAFLLDGGMEAWIRQGHAVTDQATPARQGSLQALKTRPLIVDAAEVRARLGKRGTVVVDARAAALYDGVATGGAHDKPHKTGHVAGAVSIPFSEMTNDDLLLRPAAELAALFEKAGVKKGDTVLAYCHIGQQATAVLFAARSLGHPVLLYDGSFEEWSRLGHPVENPSEATP